MFIDIINSFIHSFGMCRMRRFYAVLRSFFHACLFYILSCHPSPPTILSSSLTPTCFLFLGLPLNLVVPKFIYNTLCTTKFNIQKFCVVLTLYTMSEKDCTLFLFFFLGAQCVESGVSCTDCY